MNGSIQLLEQTSKLVDLFKSTQPMTSLKDPKLLRAKEALEFFQKWESTVWSNELDPIEKQRCLLSQECRRDLTSTVLGFEKMLFNRLKRFPNSYIIPAVINSDICENIFCQVRSTLLGPTTHPNYSNYVVALSSVLLSQGLLSTHGNAGNNSVVASPFKFHSDQPLRRYKGKKTWARLKKYSGLQVFGWNEFNPTENGKCPCFAAHLTENIVTSNTHKYWYW